MGKSSASSSSRSRRKRQSLEDESCSSPSSSDNENSDRMRWRRRKRSSRHHESSSRKKRHHHSNSSKKRSSSRKKEATRDDEKRSKRRKHMYNDVDESKFESEHEWDEPETLARFILEEPDIATDLEQLLQMIDNGQGVDVRGLSDKSLVRNLERLFVSLKLKQSGSRVFLLPPLGHHTLDIIGPILVSHLILRNNHLSNFGSPIREQSSLSDSECGNVNMDAARMAGSVGKDEPLTPRRRWLELLMRRLKNHTMY